jgi:hypothetical protein
MREQWELHGDFRCTYTGLSLELDDPNDVRYREWDHAIPDDETSVVLSTAVANRMKCYLRDAEFRLVVAELARHFQDPAKPFEESVLPRRPVPRSAQALWLAGLDQ